MLRVDKKGDFLWDTKDVNAFEDYLEPVPDLLITNQAYYFFCNDRNDEKQPPTLLKISEENKDEVSEVTKISFIDHLEPFDLSYSIIPIHASIICDNNYILVTLDNIGDTLAFIGDGNNNTSWKETVHDRWHWAGWVCISTYNATDRRFHYTGRLKTKGKYYFHTFQQNIFNISPDRCFMIRMEAPNGGEIHPDIYIKHPCIAMEWDDTQWDVSNWDGTQWDGLKLSGAFIDNNIIHFFVNGRVEMNEQTQHPQIEFEGDPQPELLETKPVYIKTIPINDQNIVFFAGSTRSDNIVLCAYIQSTGSYLAVKYLGDIHIYEAAGLIDTEDGGLAILGTTYVTGLLGRICLFKLSKAELEAFVGLQ